MAKAFELTVKEKGKVIRNLIKRDERFIRDVRKNFVIAGDEFIQLIRSRWYSGRRADDTGLNRITHLLYNTWRSELSPRTDFDIVVRMANGAKYAEVHELEEVGNAPKRSFVIEDLKSNIGKKIFVDAARKALKANF